MRININTQEPVRDIQVRALYVIDYALRKMLEPRMVIPTLQFFADKYGFEVNSKSSSR
jgi:hypothetical protein